MRTQSICSFKCEHSINHPIVFLLLKPSCLLNSNTRIRKLRLKKKKKQKSTDFTNLVSNILFAFGRMIPGCLKQKETLLSQETEGQSFLPHGRRRRGRGTARLRAALLPSHHGVHLRLPQLPLGKRKHTNEWPCCFS